MKRKDVSPPQDFIVNTHHIGSDGDRKMASLNSCRRPCASGTAVELEGGERAAKQGEEVFWSVCAHGLCWKEEVRYKEKEMSPQPRGANLKPALSFFRLPEWQQHICAVAASHVWLMSAHISAQMLFPVGICALTGRPIRHRDEETAVFWFCVCAAASRFEPGVTPCQKLCKGKPEQCGARGKTTTISGICRWSKREMAGWLRLGQ